MRIMFGDPFYNNKQYVFVCQWPMGCTQEITTDVTGIACPVHKVPMVTVQAAMAESKGRHPSTYRSGILWKNPKHVIETTDSMNVSQPKEKYHGPQRARRNRKNV